MKNLIVLLTVILLWTLSAEAQAKSPLPAPEAKSASPLSEIFKPNPQINTTINHRYWDAFLKKTVLFTGPSIREYQSAHTAITGSHLKSGHESRLRLEGNKVFFSQFSDNHIKIVREYRKGLEELARVYDITEFPRKEQLAFWLNLHNAVVIETLGDNYPVRKPSKLFLKTQGAKFNDAKIVEISGGKLSLREIREDIVFANWNNPVVFYGFFQGDIGSPSIQRSAYSAENLDGLLASNANEFVNSLRGYSAGRVSKHYEIMAPYYFENFETDLEDHLKPFMRGEVLKEFEKHGVTGIARYEDEISDLSGGRANVSTMSNVTIAHGPFLTMVPADASGGGMPVSGSGSFAQPQGGSVGRFLVEINNKLVKLKARGLIKEGEVIVEDLDPENAEE